ncbi:hypothetical protein UFOVP148_50 [uncultured Caudovirales phage]|uniref:Phage neck terminator protein gp12-like domain-containing protein n=1 Tax=uncultured Caudovirales phage TaxID=2100421 RepID=A0A6J7W507_9CAUD|nr:hypothetical protein UFOVP148_50 [uncultured Caudovirales phage]
MAVTIDIVDQDVFRALVVFFRSFLDQSIPVIQQQDNRVPMPKGGFVAMNNIGMDRLSFNIDGYDAVNQGKTILTPTKFDMQLDFYGPTSQEWAMKTVALFRDEYATEIFPANIQPLYADDPVQIPLIDGEAQYEQRWKLAASLQYNPILSTAQQSMLGVDIGLAPIDQTFNP